MKSPLGSRRRTVLAAAVSLALAGSASADINVSQLVLGVQEPMPAASWFGTPCGSACRYTTVSGTQMGNGYAAWPGDLTHAAWPVFPSPMQPTYSVVQDDLAVAPPPAGSQYVGLTGGVRQRSRVAFSPSITDPASARQLDVQTFASGTGASALSYAVRIEAPAGPSRKTFLRFAVPTLVRDGIHASQAAGPSGQEPVVTWPRRLQARTAVDVYVDGLPVWSSESMRLQPRRYQPDTPGELMPGWGGPMDGGTATLFLGSLPALSVRTAVIVMRSDLRVDAPTCHTDHLAYGTDLRRCDAQLEGLRLPSRSAAPFYFHAPDITVFTQ